jgi:hypothetical protein
VTTLSRLASNDLVYVLIEGDAAHAGNIVGFRVNGHGDLSALLGPSRNRPRSRVWAVCRPERSGWPRASADGSGFDVVREVAELLWEPLA